MPNIQAPLIALLKSAFKSDNQAGIVSGYSRELIVSELMPQYYYLIKLGAVYYTVASAINPAAFNGGAGGTPIIGIHNPSNSGVDIVILQVRIALQTTGTAAVAWDINWWLGPSAAPTGTRTNPFNMYTQQQSGSGALVFVNTAMTGSTALNGGPVPVLSGGLTATTAVTDVLQALDDTKGGILVSPGNLAALGQAAALTAAKVDVAVLWAEIAA